MISEIVKWFVVMWIALGTLGTIFSVGEPRDPITNTAAAIITVANALLIVAIVALW